MLVEAKMLGKDFSRKGLRGESSFSALSNVSLAVEEGAFVTITGKSGSGKTTLLTLLAGLARPTSGQVFFRGTDLYSLPDKKISAIRNQEIGFVPQGAGLLANLTVLDNIRSPQIFAGKGGADSGRAAFLLEAFGMQELAEEYPHSLSGGEMRRASVARALFNDPALLIADEPTSDLDPENTGIVLDLLQKIHEQGTAVIIVTHEKEVAALGKSRYSMSAGVLVRET